MNRIENKFLELKKGGKKALIAFITAGDPDLKTTEELVLTIEENGADIVELGVPFSDPLADGPVIQKANLRALKSNTNLRQILKLVSDLRKKTQIPIVLMSCYNPIFFYGDEGFMSDCSKFGVDGLIIPDLPPEEALNIEKFAKKRLIDIIHLIAPTTDKKRIEYISKKSSGFLYYISITGVTGTRREVSGSLKENLASIRKITDLPVAVGFGVSEPSHIKAVGQSADAAVVGSAFVKIIEKYNNNKSKMLREIGILTKTLKGGFV